MFQLKSPLKITGKNGGHYHFKPGNTVVVLFVVHFGPVSVNFDPVSLFVASVAE